MQVPSVAWDDIGGYEEVKQALREMIEVLMLLC
jgi:SpoVK/Ycf46/Vps4 family AAA+-type ATPase